jgi:histidyl-tRNA synthetase
MYTFDDKKGRSLSLRPEGTGGIVRAAIEHGLLGDALPLKVYYFTTCYRYEAPQSGRYREFSQFGVEVFGADKPDCDVELIALAESIFNRIGITGYRIELNSIGCKDCRRKFQDALREYYGQFSEKLCRDCIERLERNPMRLLDCKAPACAGYRDNAPVILDYQCAECETHFGSVKAGLDALNIDYTVNPLIVRGLDYYTNTVVEFISADGLPVFGGGGRYNGLVEEIGGNPLSGAGYGLGMERMIAMMEHCGAPFEPAKACDIYIAGLGEEAAVKAMKMVHELREHGFWAETDLTGRSVKAQMKYADKLGARYSMVIGSDELESGKAFLRDMQKGEKVEVSIEDGFADRVDAMLLGLI